MSDNIDPNHIDNITNFSWHDNVSIKDNTITYEGITTYTPGVESPLFLQNDIFLCILILFAYNTLIFIKELLCLPNLELI